MAVAFAGVRGPCDRVAPHHGRHRDFRSVQARLAAILLTAMFVSFMLLVHPPMLFANPPRHWIWSEHAINAALIGPAWVVADSLGKKSGPRLTQGPQRLENALKG